MKPITHQGVFYGVRINVLGNVIQAFNDNDMPLDEFKILCNKIAKYLYHEGFVDSNITRIEIRKGK